MTHTRTGSADVMAPTAGQDGEHPYRDDARLRDAVVDHSYDVALEPRRLPDLIGPWEKFITPHWYRTPQARRSMLESSGLLGHLRRFEQILGLGGHGARQSPEREMLRRYRRAAAFTINRELRISAVNGAAEGMLGVREGQPLTELQVRDEDLAYLSKIAHGMLTADGDRPVEPTRIVRARRLADDSLVLLMTYLTEPEDSTPFVLVATTEVHWPPGAADLLRDAFDLTPAEAEIMMGLTRHHSLKDIAAARGRSVDTVRSQIKSILAKTEARGQSDLLRIAMSVMDIAPVESNRIGPEGEPAFRTARGGLELPTLPFRHILRPDGRRFDYLEYGDPKGRPVLYFSSTFGLCRWPASAEFAASQTGIRVIAPIRSGFGGSSPLAEGADRVSTFAADVAALMDHLRIGAAPLLVADEDMIYAARLAALAPGRVTGIVGCSAFLPLSHPEQFERMGRWHRFVLGTARFAPQLLPFVVRAAFAMARQVGKAEFVRLVYGGSPADVAMTRNSRMFEAVDCGSDVVLSEGFDAARAYAQEVSIVHCTEWRSELEALRDTIPVVNIFGTEDQGVPPATVDDYAQDYPWVRFVRVEAAGSFLFFQHWDRVLNELEKMLRNVT
jgi:pimeloyl-ACP methyl ester carboxylesterase/DNA-binding CsgD family transcriptional regulator